MYSTKAHALCWILLSAFMLQAASATAQAQTVSFNQQTPVTTRQPFSAIDDSLTKAADTLLVSPASITPPAPTRASEEEKPSLALDLRISQQPRSLLNAGLALAAARLDLLRPIIEPILRKRGVPIEMAAVVAVESGGRSAALSPKGARGLWQLMPETARRYGLRVDETQDDRIDLFKSTDAAARYLHDLYTQFGDWKLALAAYNTGEANVGSAILKAHTQDFDQLINLRLLPLETRDYVPRVLATARFLEKGSALDDPKPLSGAITVFALSNY